MNAVVVVIAILGPATIAWLLLRSRLDTRNTAERAELAGIALAISIGCTGSVFFLWRLAGMPIRLYPWADSVAQAVFLVGAIYAARRTQPSIPIGATPTPGTWRTPAGVLALGVVVVAAALVRRFTTQLPHGEWDAWAIWNLRAAFLSVPDAHWRDGFTPLLQWSHPDYPLLLPSSVARLWTFGESGSVIGPRLLAIAFVASSTLVMAGSVARRAGAAAMSLAVALLLVPAYLYWGSSQTADVALGTYVLIAATSLSAVSMRNRYLVAGLAAGCAVWTKNEGLVAAAAIAVSALLAARMQRSSRRELIRFPAALAVAAVPLVLFRMTLSPPSDLLTQVMQGGPLAKATEASRHIVVGAHLARELWQWGGLTPIPAPALLLPCVVVAAWRWRQLQWDAAQGALIVSLMLAGYYCLYVVSPYDLDWHLRTSAPRLIAQVWPVIVWSCVIASTAPLNAAAPPSGAAARGDR